MATYSIASVASDEVLLGIIVATANAVINAQNAVLAAQTPPGTPIPLVTKASLIQTRFSAATANDFAQNQPAFMQAIVTAFQAASAGAKSTALATLGLTGFAGVDGPDLLIAFKMIGWPNYLALTPTQQNAFLAGLGLTA